MLRVQQRKGDVDKLLLSSDYRAYKQKKGVSGMYF